MPQTKGKLAASASKPPRARGRMAKGTVSVAAKHLDSKASSALGVSFDDGIDDPTDDGAASLNSALANSNLLSTEVQEEHNDFVKPRTVTIEQPPVGFFIQGSSIRDMCGVYVMQSPPIYEDDDKDDIETLLYYKHVDNNWTLEQLRRGRRVEWNLVDEDGQERFMQPGAKLVPGAGVRWGWVHRSSGDGSMVLRAGREPNALVGQEVTEATPDDENDLPWQVIALLDPDTLREVLDGADQHKSRMRAEGAADGDGGSGGGDGDGPGSLLPAASEAEEALAKEVDHYKVLGVPAGATEKQIQHAYRLASLKYHPDRKGGSKRAFQRVQSAYETLADEERRHAYDSGVQDEAAREAEFESWRHLYCPFGDPFVNKRKLAAQRRAAESKDAKESSPDLKKQSAASPSRGAATTAPNKNKKNEKNEKNEKKG